MEIINIIQKTRLFKEDMLLLQKISTSLWKTEH